MAFKAHPYEGELTPSGYWVTLRAEIDAPGWLVTVYNFATWRHQTFRFADEATARRYFIQWTL